MAHCVKVGVQLDVQFSGDGLFYTAFVIDVSMGIDGFYVHVRFPDLDKQRWKPIGDLKPSVLAEPAEMESMAEAKAKAEGEANKDTPNAEVQVEAKVKAEAKAEAKADTQPLLKLEEAMEVKLGAPAAADVPSAPVAAGVQSATTVQCMHHARQVMQRMQHLQCMQQMQQMVAMQAEGVKAQMQYMQQMQQMAGIQRMQHMQAMQAKGTEGEGKGAANPAGVAGSSQRTLRSSNYLNVYDRTPKRPQENPAIVQTIMKDLTASGCDDVAKAFLRHLQNGHSVNEAAIVLWTEKTTTQMSSVHVRLNKLIIDDDITKLKPWMNIVRLITNYITRPARSLSVDLVLWRGSRLTSEQIKRLHIGEVIRPPMFVATSTSKKVAKRFRKTVLVKLTVPSGCRNACNVKILSEFNRQNEVLLPPYTPLKVLKVAFGNIEVLVLNGLQHERDTELPASQFSPALEI